MPEKFVTDGMPIRLPGVPKGMQAYRCDDGVYIYDTEADSHVPLKGYRGTGEAVKQLKLYRRHKAGLPPYTTTDPEIARTFPKLFELTDA